jgi:serine/threonine protein kinase
VVADDRRFSAFAPQAGEEEDGDETLVLTVRWSDLAPLRRPPTPPPAPRPAPPNDLEKTADEGTPAFLSPGLLAAPPVPREPLLEAAREGLPIETARTPPAKPAKPAMPAAELEEPPLDRTQAWHAPPRGGSLEAGGAIVAGRYRLGPILGRGGMGTVFEAQHTDLGKRVAIKVLAPMLDGETEATARFLQEAKASSTIESEHIAQVFDVGEDLHLGLYMVMELLKGEDLARVLATRGPLRPEVAAGVVAQVCLALERAHAAGVVHRDLKPGNVFLTHGDDGSIKVKVLDFGIAKLLLDARSRTLGITQRGIVMGTPHYMSPEQAQGLETVDHRTDLYSLGVLLFEAVAGSPPYPELPSYEKTLTKILREDPPRLVSKVPEVNPAICQLVADLMARDPARRPSSAKEVRARLAAIFPALGKRSLVFDPSGRSIPNPPLVAPRTGSGITVDSGAEKTIRHPRRPPAAFALLLGGAALSLVSAGVAYFALRSPPAERTSKAIDSVAVLGATLPAAGAQVSTGAAAPSPPTTGVAAVLGADAEIASLIESAEEALAHGDSRRARDLATEATRRAPANAEAWFTLGAALEALGDAPAARSAYLTCKALAEGDRARECAAHLEK